MSLLEGLQEFLYRKKLDKAWLEFAQEARDNFDSYHVMTQIDKLVDYQFGKWAVLHSLLKEVPSPVITDYVRELTSYNQVYDDYRQYEAWYKETRDHQTREKALMLHEKKDKLREQLKLTQVPLNRIKEYLIQKLNYF